MNSHPFTSPVHNQHYNNLYYFLESKSIPPTKAHWIAVAKTRKDFNLTK